jgi:hypothetical protein
MAKRYLIDEPDDSNWDLNQERTFWERMLNQKINFFLAFFVILIIGAAVANTKELTLFILSVGAIILWILTVSIINTTRKINFAVKELSKSGNHPTGVVDRKAKGRLVRLMLGFGLPIFCSSVITLIYLAGLSGLYSFRFPTKPEVVRTVQTTLENGKESLIDKKPAEDYTTHFENVDSIIRKNKSVRVYVPIDSTSRLVSKQKIVLQPDAKNNPNFRTIDKVISGSEVYSSTAQASPKPLNPVKSAKPQLSNPHFKNIDKVISKTESVSVTTTTGKQPVKKEKTNPALPENPNFKKIEKVITTPEKD